MVRIGPLHNSEHDQGVIQNDQYKLVENSPIHGVKHVNTLDPIILS